MAGRFLPRVAPCLLAGVFLATLALSGCQSSYSTDLRYPVRTDPLVLKTPNDIVKERNDPVRPGIFPIFSAADLNDPRNPLHNEKAKLFKDGYFRDPN